MPSFLSDEDYARCSHDPSLITHKADTFIRQLYNQLENQKAEQDASSITAEQTCSILEQKFVSLKSEFVTLQSQHSEASSSLEERASEVAQIQADKHQIYLLSVISISISFAFMSRLSFFCVLFVTIVVLLVVRYLLS